MTQVIPKVLPWNHIKVLCSLNQEGGYAFNFKLPKEGLSLYSVRVTNGVPELVFRASRNVPTIQEDDVATAFRLAQENERPEFFYLQFPPFHPLQGRWYKHYSPGWLQGTGIGKLLADTDWNMKCLHVGARSNEEKTKFQSWESSSNLSDIASRLDFPREKQRGSIIMSCEQVKVQIDENEMIFPEDPKIIITDEASKLYSKYISDIFPSIAYHDEPNFLKLREVIKLVVAVEWLCQEKGVKVDQEWIRKQTSKTKSITSKMPPSNMIPQLPESIQPKTDVAVETWEAQKNVSLISKCGTKRLYGKIDQSHSEAFLFEEDGTPVPTPRSIKFSFQHNTPAGSVTGFHNIQLPANCQTSDQLSEIKDKMLSTLKEKDHVPKHASTKIVVEEATVEKSSMKLKVSRSLPQHPPIAGPGVTETKGVVATIDNFDLLYKDIDPNWLIAGAGKIINPNVTSWKELITERSELPPVVIQSPFCALLEPMCGGGVSTQQIPVSRKTRPAEYVTEPVRCNVGVYSSGETKLKVRATNPNQRELSVISNMFTQNWIGRGPKPEFVFKVSNDRLEREWNDYKKTLQYQQHESFYHGTSVCEMITTSEGQYCYNDPECGICGISANGMNLEFAGKSFPEFQRFGKGIYLAPNSSKSDDYTKKNRLGYRAMLVCDVLLGRPYIIKDGDSEDIQGPIPGYNSIVVQKGKHRVPEIVVFDEQAVLPRYIIVYRKTEDK